MKKKSTESPRRSEPLVLGVSACLLGQAVRYDGDSHAHEPLLSSTRVRWVPVCPEVEVGMPVPREPIRIESTPSGLRLVAVESREEHTEAMAGWAETRLEALAKEGIRGFVLKARSPSCAHHDAAIFEQAGTMVPATCGPGMFAAALQRRFPDLPVADEHAVQTSAAFDKFLDEVTR